MKPGKKTAAVALLIVCLVLVNYLASSLPLRVDATAERIYTLSPGTKALLAKVRMPMTLDLYFSKDVNGLPIAYKDYAARVREMLGQYVRASHGKITLNVVDPEPDTAAEEKATAAGLEAQRMQAGGDSFYFGLVATQADQQRVIGSLTPDREQFLEYDVSELIYRTENTDKLKLGLITSLPLQGGAGNPMTGQPGQDAQYVITEWEDTFDIVPVDASATQLPAHLDVLAIVHPENLVPQLQYAIDQFLLSGKPVFLAVDPTSEYFKQQGGQSAMMGGQAVNVSSDLPALLGAWGIAYDPQKIVGDNDEALSVQNPSDGSEADYATWLNLGHDNFNATAVPTAQLSSLWVADAGSISLKPGAHLTFTALVQTDAKAGEVDAMAAQTAQPADLGRQLVPSGRKVIAALVTGKFKSAFPEGPPPPDKGSKPAPSHAPGLAASRTTSTLLIVADTDWLQDAYSIRKGNLLGTTTVEPMNDNLSFAANSLDFLAGSQDLLSIRGKGDSLRPFVVVKRMEAKANEKYDEKLNALESQLSDVQAKLGELQGKKNEGNRLIATPEVTRAIEDFQKQEAALSAERRTIRHALNESIDSLENRLLAINLLATPLLVCLFGVWFYRSRKK